MLLPGQWGSTQVDLRGFIRVAVDDSSALSNGAT